MARRGTRLLLVGTVALVVAWLGVGGRPDATGVVGAHSVEAEPTRRLATAAVTQAATRARLRVADAPSCEEAGVVAYRRSELQPGLVDQWYVVSQLWADAELLRGTGGSGGDQPEARCHLEKGLAFLARLWDPESGGYYPRSDLHGVDVERAVRYADDNALAGLALLGAAGAQPDPAARRRYLEAAIAQADYLVRSGLWDGTFGGGFWWNTNAGDRYEGKPAQTNALAALFFARLHAVSGDPAHREWALRTLDWLDATLYDPDQELYRWSVRYEDPALRAGEAVFSTRYFNYDQGIAIEAQIAAAGLDGDPARLSRARGLGRALHARFWGRERDGYNLQTGIERVYTSYGAWASLGHLALYDLDGDPGWLDMARANADALIETTGESDGGYAYRHYRCVTRNPPGCESGEPLWVLDRTRDTSAQAWMQHLQAAIAQRMSLPRPEPLPVAAAPVAVPVALAWAATAPLAVPRGVMKAT